MAFCKNCGKEIKDGEKCSCENEVKFCKSCGKKLVGNETCDCGGVKQAAAGSFDFVSTMKAIKDDLLATWKKPVDVIRDNANANDLPKMLIGLAVVALSFGLFIAGIFKYIYALLMDTVMIAGASSKITNMIKLPYFKIIIFAMILWAVATLGYAVAILAVQAIFKNKKLSFKEGLALTVASHYPLVWANVICAVLSLINLNIGVILIPWMVINIIVMYNLAHAYGEHTNVAVNKFGYALTVLVCIAGLISGICSYVVVPSMSKSIATSIVKSTAKNADLDLDLDDIDDLLNGFGY